MDGLVRKMGIGIGWDVDNSGLVEANNATDGLVDSAEDAESSMDGLSDTGVQSGSRLSRAFDGFTDKIQTGINKLEDMRYKLTGIAAAGAGAILGAVNMAGDIEESINTITREFGDSADAIIGFAQDYAKATELTEAQTLDWTKTLGLNLRMLDLSSDETANMTEELIKMTHNFSHFTDMDPQQAFNSIHQAIRGGRFPRALRDLTGQVRQTDIESRAMTMGLVEQGEEMDQQAERIATISMLIEELSITQGAAEDGQEEWNTRFTEFRGIIGDITRDMGDIYLPTLSRGLNVTNGFLNALRENRLLKVAAGFAGLITVVAGLGAAIGFAKWGFSALLPYLTTTVSIFGLFSAPVWAVVAAVVGLGLVIEDLWVGFQGGESVIFEFIGWLGNVLGIADEMQSTFSNIKNWFSNMIGDLIQAGSGFIQFFKGIGQFIYGVFTFDKEMIVQGLENIKDGFINFFDGFGGFLLGLLEGAIRFAFGAIELTIRGLVSGLNLIDTIADNVTKTFLWGLSSAWEAIKGWFSNHFDFGGLIDSAIEKLPGFLQGKVRDMFGFDKNKNNNTDSIEEEAEREAQETQRRVQNNNRSVSNRVDVREIKVEAADNPEETGRAVRKEIEAYLGMEAAEVGAN